MSPQRTSKWEDSKLAPHWACLLEACVYQELRLTLNCMFSIGRCTGEQFLLLSFAVLYSYATSYCKRKQNWCQLYKKVLLRCSCFLRSRCWTADIAEHPTSSLKLSPQSAISTQTLPINFGSTCSSIPWRFAWCALFHEMASLEIGWLVPLDSRSSCAGVADEDTSTVTIWAEALIVYYRVSPAMRPVLWTDVPKFVLIELFSESPLLKAWH